MLWGLWQHLERHIGLFSFHIQVNFHPAARHLPLFAIVLEQESDCCLIPSPLLQRQIPRNL